VSQRQAAVAEEFVISLTLIAALPSYIPQLKGGDFLDLSGCKLQGPKLLR
jgi:hypothetical protein